MLSNTDLDKAKRRRDIVAWRAGFYRENPQRFVKDYLGLHLRIFQQIILYSMMHNNYNMLIAARGIGKTYMMAIYCVVRCILFPKTKIVVCSGTLDQAAEVILKIQDELMPNSPILKTEIKDIKTNPQEKYVLFKNQSWIRAVTSKDTARGKRANILIIDEFRMVSKSIVDTVVRKFLTNPRQPNYLHNPKYSDLLERNVEIYATSAYFKSSWAWDKVKAYVNNFVKGIGKYFICALPYQLSIKEGLLMREQVEDEMSELDFNEMIFDMEMGCMWIGETNDSLFKFEDIDRCRVLSTPLPQLNDKKTKIPKPKPFARRILSLDVALMSSTSKRKNDAAAFWINDAELIDNVSYHSNLTYCETFEGLTTDALGIITMRYFYEYECTDLVIDTQGLGLGVADFIVKDQFDEMTGKVYKALSFVNDKEMAKRCKVSDANACAYSVKANESFNNLICVLLRNGIDNGRLSFLKSESFITDYIKDFNKFSPTQQALAKKPYLNTTFAVYELVKLKHKITNGNIKVETISGMRKDRFSSLAYNYWLVSQLELKLKPQVIKGKDKKKLFSFRAPKDVKQF